MTVLTVAFLLLIVLHEAAHAVAALLFGYALKPYGTLPWRGTGTWTQRALGTIGVKVVIDAKHPPMTWQRMVVMAFAGPYANLLAGVCLLLLGLPVLAGMSLALGLLNLIPLKPMDGWVIREFARNKPAPPTLETHG